MTSWCTLVIPANFVIRQEHQEQAGTCTHTCCCTCYHISTNTNLLGPWSTIVVKKAFTCQVSGLAYSISCCHCPAIYISETDCTLRQRLHVGKYLQNIKKNLLVLPSLINLRQLDILLLMSLFVEFCSVAWPLNGSDWRCDWFSDLAPVICMAWISTSISFRPGACTFFIFILVNMVFHLWRAKHYLKYMYGNCFHDYSYWPLSCKSFYKHLTYPNSTLDGWCSTETWPI